MESALQLVTPNIERATWVLYAWFFGMLSLTGLVLAWAIHQVLQERGPLREHEIDTQPPILVSVTWSPEDETQETTTTSAMQ